MKNSGKIVFCFLVGAGLICLCYFYLNKDVRWIQHEFLRVHPYDILVLLVLVLAASTFLILGLRYLIEGRKSAENLKSPD